VGSHLGHENLKVINLCDFEGNIGLKIHVNMEEPTKF